MSLAFLVTTFVGLVCYCYGATDTTTQSNYGFWVENKEIWAFDYCNILRSGPNGSGESSRFECRNGNWVTKIWKDNTDCSGEPTIMDTASCISPYCTCNDKANENNKLIEFKMYDDPHCNGDYFSTTAAVIDQCFEFNNKGYILQCTDNSITRTEYTATDCSDIKTSITTEITPQNTDYYCYSWKCGTNAVKFDDNSTARIKGISALLLAFIFTIYVLFQN
mmetsp:Transcript_48180/g.43196  ORF Transcript_48180/g.43196 Transcript_48180/m.43196 type:complete len:221 (+) Transcript_48180:34-696(+)